MSRWPCEETTLDLESHGFEVRLWITGSGADVEAWRRDVDEQVYDRVRFDDEGVEEIANAIAEAGVRAGLAAVQVRRNGVGHMIYTIRFDE